MKLVSGAVADNIVTVKDGENTYRINLLFGPEEIRLLTISYLGCGILFPLFSGVLPPALPKWMPLSYLVLMVPFTIISILFVVYAKKLIVEFWLYMSFGSFLLAANLLVFGLKIFKLFTIKFFVIYGLLYLATLTLILAVRFKLLSHETRQINSGKYLNKYTTQVGLFAIAGASGMALERTGALPDSIGEVLAALVFIVLPLFLGALPIQTVYKWYLLKKSDIKIKG